MRRRSLGQTGLEMPELCLGTWGLCGDGYGSVEEAEQDRVIERAVALDLKAFETADAYAEGAMESRLGRLLEKHADAIVITKVGTDRSVNPPVKRFDPDYLTAATQKSRERLKRSIDVLLLHNPSTIALTKGPVRDALVRLKEEGVIKHWGASVGSGEIGRVALEQGAEVLELAYSAFHPQDFTAVAELAKKKGAGVIARSVLLHGLLCGQWPTTKSFASGDHRRDRWTDDELKKRISQLSALRPSVTGSVTSLRSAALRYALAETGIASVVIGPRSTLQLDQLVRDAGKEPPYLTDDAKLALDRRLDNVGIRP